MVLRCHRGDLPGRPLPTWGRVAGVMLSPADQALWDELQACGAWLGLRDRDSSGAQSCAWPVPQEPAFSTAESREKGMALVVALTPDGFARGDLFWDDGESWQSFEEGDYTEILFLATHVSEGAAGGAHPGVCCHTWVLVPWETCSHGQRCALVQPSCVVPKVPD